jgi:tripartite-type tricarboxylate transporter receptor subunit TctC
MMLPRWAALTALAASLLPSAALAAQPTDWPTRPVRVIVPMGPGGGSDIVARMMAAKLTASFEQQFVVDNRGGGGGLIGIGMAVRASPDGHTLMLISGSVPATVAAHRPPYDAIGGLTGIARVAYSPLCLVVHPALPVETAPAFIEHARSRAGQLSFVVPGVGSLTHLATEYMMTLAGIRMQHVPYKSTGLGMNDLLTGQVQVMMTGLSPVVPHIQAGRLRALAVTTAARWPSQPQIPALSETLQGFDVESWFALVAPRGTPPGIVARVNAELNRHLHDPELRKLVDARGLAPAGGPPEEVDRRMRSEVERWGRIIKEANIVVAP